eukprot:1027237-Prorocentrum_minimum.AAC.1
MTREVGPDFGKGLEFRGEEVVYPSGVVRGGGHETRGVGGDVGERQSAFAGRERQRGEAGVLGGGRVRASHVDFVRAHVAIQGARHLHQQGSVGGGSELRSRSEGGQKQFGRGGSDGSTDVRAPARRVRTYRLC